MSFSLKSLSKICIETETLYAIERIPLEPRFILMINGKKFTQQVKILSGMESDDLIGQHLHYNKQKDKTLLLVYCKEIRSFLDQIELKPEDFIEDNNPQLH